MSDQITVSAEMQERFATWFRENYPGPDAIIHNPDWHAPMIFRAALYSIGDGHTDAVHIIHRLLRNLRVLTAECLEGFTIKRDPATIAPDEFELVEDDILAIIEAQAAFGPCKDFEWCDSDFLDACIAEFTRREAIRSAEGDDNHHE